jgi:hypothetical protein
MLLQVGSSVLLTSKHQINVMELARYWWVQGDCEANVPLLVIEPGRVKSPEAGL